MPILVRALGAALVTLAIAAELSGQPAREWPGFRGTGAGVVADDPALPDSWSQTENVAWSAAVPGRAWSSPIVWNDLVFVTSAVNTQGDAPLKPVGAYLSRALDGPMTGADVHKTAAEHRWMLYAFDFASGALRWEREVIRSTPSETTHQKNSFASETPVTDGQRVYVYLGHAGIFAFNMDGTQAWSVPIGPFPMRMGWGTAASPALHNGRLYIVNDNETQSFLAAFDAATGRELWRVNRDEASNWTTPYVWVNERRTEIVTSGTRKVRSYGLDGTLLWEIAGMSNIDIPSPFASGGLLYVASGYPADQRRPTYAIRPGASGDISLPAGATSGPFVAWFHPTLGPYNPTPLVYDGYYYTLNDRGFLTCHDAATGREVYGRQRIAADASGFTASPWAYNDRIFALSEDGTTYVIAAGPEFKVIGRSSLDDMTLATPAVARGSVVLRTASRLYRLARTPR